MSKHEQKTHSSRTSSENTAALAKRVDELVSKKPLTPRSSTLQNLAFGQIRRSAATSGAGKLRIFLFQFRSIAGCIMLSSCSKLWSRPSECPISWSKTRKRSCCFSFSGLARTNSWFSEMWISPSNSSVYSTLQNKVMAR